jgi:hypothetical protein
MARKASPTPKPKTKAGKPAGRKPARARRATAALPATARQDTAAQEQVVFVEEATPVAAEQEAADAPSAAPPAPVQRGDVPLSQEIPGKGDGGLTLPEQFLLVALHGDWDDAMLRARPGAQGAAIAGSLLLELALRGAVKVQRGRFVVETDSLPPEWENVAADVRGLSEDTTQVVLEKLTKDLGARIRPWVQALERRGTVREERVRRFGILSRSRLVVVDETPKAKLENRLVRVLAGGGNPDARTILLLGLVQASGLLRAIVPAQAYEFNRKRIQALLSGRDTMSYRVDDSIRRVQDLAVQTVLQDIRVLQGT